MMLAVFFTAAPVMAADAEASGSLWKDVIKFTKEKISKEKNITIYNQVEEEVTKDKQGKRKKEARKKEAPQANPDLKEIEKQAEFASQMTGVRKDFLMGMLVVESDLGQNTGQCTYKEVKEGAEELYRNGVLSEQSWNNFLGRKKIIEEIASDLGYDHDQIRVSCNPPQDLYVGTGGAMGIPQFMPDTWLEYKDRISKITGKKHPDPWDVRDGVVAMALKVADVPGVAEHNVWAERAASKMYLSGTTSWQYDWYANEIQYWAGNYKKLLG